MARTLVIDTVALTTTALTGPFHAFRTTTTLAVAATLAVCAARLQTRDHDDPADDPVTVP